MQHRLSSLFPFSHSDTAKTGTQSDTSPMLVDCFQDDNLVFILHVLCKNHLLLERLFGVTEDLDRQRAGLEEGTTRHVQGGLEYICKLVQSPELGQQWPQTSRDGCEQLLKKMPLPRAGWMLAREAHGKAGGTEILGQSAWVSEMRRECGKRSNVGLNMMNVKAVMMFFLFLMETLHTHLRKLW